MCTIYAASTEFPIAAHFCNCKNKVNYGRGRFYTLLDSTQSQCAVKSSKSAKKIREITFYKKKKSAKSAI